MTGSLPGIARGIIRIAVLTAVAVAGTGAWGQAPDALVLEDVTVIDGTGAAPRPGMTIVISEGRIAALFPTAGGTPPAGATRLDVAGRFVMPGLIDAHVHLATTERPALILASLMQATLLGGVTSVRDMGGNGDVVSALARAAEVPGALSPAVYRAAVFAGPDSFWFTDRRAPWFSGKQPPSATPWLVRVDGATDIRGAVRRAKAWGAKGVKMYSDLTPGQMDAIAGAARREGLSVWSHATVTPARPGAAIDARVNSLSHAEYLAWEGRTGVRADLFGRPAGMLAAMVAVPPDGEVIRSLLKRMRERSVMLEPTLFIGVQTASFAGDDRPRLDQQVAYAAAVTALAQAAGVGIVAGTDALGGSSPNLHAELQLLVRRAGLTPLQAIRAATFNAARATGAADEIGSVVVGRRADLVVLDRNPAEDIRNTQTIHAVIRAGVVHRRVLPMAAPPFAEPPAAVQ
jgi:imidazolonepropionase-like amidohydrolase